jgi:hypothetical protein
VQSKQQPNFLPKSNLILDNSQKTRLSSGLTDKTFLTVAVYGLPGCLGCGTASVGFGYQPSSGIAPSGLG